MTDYPIKPYTKQELGMMYNPGATPRAAQQLLRRWIQRCPDLCKALEHASYTPHQKLLTAKQVALIFHYLGPP